MLNDALQKHAVSKPNSSYAVRFDQVTKIYRLGQSRKSLRETLTDKFRGRPSAALSKSGSQFSALKNVSFTIEHGEVVGIIGNNGAGKTTLLKLLSQVSKPTTGKLATQGRISALIELGAGFHPELSGKENVFLNAAILGLSRKQVLQRYDDIVNFAGLESFMDTPVKRYSSGMFVRLGFAVAAHVEPEILLVDEVLSVGDVVFQQKCLQRIKDLREKGTTIVLVSHNLSSVRNHCSRVIWLEKGQIREDGSSNSVIQHYVDAMASTINDADAVGYAPQGRWGTGEARITEIRVENNDGDSVQDIRPEMPICIRLKFHASKPIEQPMFWIAVGSDEHGKICGTTSSLTDVEAASVHGSGEIVCTIPELPLRPGDYALTVGIFSHDRQTAYDRWGNAAILRVLHSDSDLYAPEFLGFVRMEGSWETPILQRVPGSLTSNAIN